ncbi:hypothetical protein ACTI_85440 [Actinoplanes sp. OR16]|uniref:hypothetical protein n=1 Tax=Actinoplanes sp. OR16 TaxID=946334 RepID=UPI000F706BE6|nr:hypothetical protein [Actinoplanes sp. OR16]BBH71859.1 hypothetical protein ACTI_85440 [Actinoplanes sp. OR16]
MLSRDSEFPRIMKNGRTSDGDPFPEDRFEDPPTAPRPAPGGVKPIEVTFPTGEIFLPPGKATTAGPFPTIPITLPPAERDPDIPRFSGPHTTTLLVEHAIASLDGLPADTIRAALSFVQAKPQKVAPGELFEDLRQRTSFDEVLRERAEGWRPVTRRVFADVFAMPGENLAAMDAIVCIALLNRPDLEQALRAENAVAPTVEQLLENRRILWQYPPSGTPLTPPYVIVVAVESTDTGPAEDVVVRIMSSLVTAASGYRLPRLAAQKSG